MTAVEIIDQIRKLSPEERGRVIDYLVESETRLADGSRSLSGTKLAQLAESLTEANDPAERSRLRGAIIEGFYGSVQPTQRD